MGQEKNISFKLDMFRDAYDSAMSAYNRGDIPAAKRGMLRAADIMEDIAANSEGSLKQERAERAKKLRYLADNLKSAVSASGEGGGSEPTFIRRAKPTERMTFDDIIGLESAKEAIHRLLIDPLKNPEVFARYGIKAGGFILLEGPPGTGKTTFAKAAACSLDVPFAEVNANALVDSYIGKTGKNIDKLFDEARALSKAEGKPVVLFLDEIDYLAQKRGGENKTAAEAVPTLIKQMDGFSTGADDIVLIAATNIKDALDPAILSRFRNVINIPLPSEGERRAMFAAKLKGIDEADLAALDLYTAARVSDGFSGRDINGVCLDLKNALAARDAGIRGIDAPLGELLVSLINKKKA